MNTLRQKKLLIISVLISFSLACSLTGRESTPIVQNSDDAIATAVASTLAADQSGSPAEPSSTWTEAPPENAAPPEPNFNYLGVSFYFDNQLAANLTGGIKPSDYTAEASWWSTPEHREFLFNNWAVAGAFHQPVIRIYPVAEFKDMNENIAESLDALKASLAAQSPDGAGLFVPDMFNAGQLFQSNIRYLDFQNGSGARWLSQYGQAYFPIGFPYLFYTYQGFTTDGKYYISMVLPVNHPSLLNTSDVTMDDAFYNDIDNYTAEVRIQLDGQADSSFVPSLVLLDEIVQSMLVGEP